MRKKINFIIIFFVIALNLYSFDEGFVWGLRANFNGTATLPSISASDLDKLGAAYMKGSVGYTMDGEAELGYLFGSERWFNGMDPSKFSGMSLYASIGVGNGFAGQVAGNTFTSGGITSTVAMYINVSYAPVVSFGVGTKAYFLNSRLALGLQVGGKLIADLSPEYLAYADDSTVLTPEVGEIIVTDFMIKNMNPLMLSIKFSLEYNQPVNDRVEVILGAYTRFNLYSPGYITMPDSLLKLLQGVRPNFSVETRLSSYYINSLDFGLTLGLAFKG
ncbi:hypothetical protein [Brachyspira sp. SAP_772]|uniref:hypothetical protein n=1 Tax=Brachyspira sp. SAP_772 TaxID=2608385 RepID=UPI0012F50FAB|nr:hypothetical protein [Brachyspira sp. SAP_772]